MPTHLIRGLCNITAAHQRGVVVIGNFDGVHVGHQKLIARARAKANALGTTCIVITFEPHPFEFFAKGPVTIPRLTRFREKFSALAACGVDDVLVLRFNQALVQMSAQAFVQEVLVERLQVQAVVVGEDFHFGHGRQGDVAFLQEQGRQYGFTAEALPSVMIDNQRVSSTLVREALKQDDHVLIQKYLGHAYAMQGHVVHGDRLGRALGFPTANLYLHRHLTPVLGIYAVRMHGIAPHPVPGVANVGTRPTVGGTRTLLEVHLLDFQQDIYGRYVSVEFCKKLREEEHYPNLTLLKQQIARDVKQAREFFSVT